jgi:hypothetical protein
VEYAVGLLLSLKSLVQNFLQFLTLGPHAIWSNRRLNPALLLVSRKVQECHNPTTSRIPFNFLLNLYTYS